MSVYLHIAKTVVRCTATLPYVANSIRIHIMEGWRSLGFNKHQTRTRKDKKGQERRTDVTGYKHKTN